MSDDSIHPPPADNPGVEFHGVRYAYLIASDVESDLIFLEVWRRDEPSGLVATISYADADDTFSIRVFDSSNLPLELVEDAIAVARRSFGPPA